MATKVESSAVSPQEQELKQDDKQLLERESLVILRVSLNAL